MPTSRLTQRRVDTLEPRRKTCDIRDAEVKGFGVRILPSGRKRYSSTAKSAAIGSGMPSAMPKTSPWSAPARGESVTGVEAVR